MRALVTGGVGFIGSHVVEALVRRGHRVRVVDNLLVGKVKNIESVRRSVEFVEGDIRDLKLMERCVQNVDVVFHQAGLRSVPKSINSPLEYHEVNATATLQLLWCAHKNGVRRVVYASSSSVYGEGAPLPQKETVLVNPQSPYAASKLSGEIYCRMFTRLYGLETVCLRYFNVFGPRQSLESQYAVVIPKFITSLLKGERPPIHGDGRQSRDFTYIENVVQANLKAAAAPQAAGEVFNVACSQHYSVLDLFNLLKKKIGTKIDPEFISQRAGDVRHTHANISKAKRLLNYRVTVPFSQGLTRTVNWFKQNRTTWDN